MQKSLSSVEQILAYFKGTERRLFYLGPYYGTTMLNINDYYPNFEMIACHDPYLGAYPFITVPESFKKSHTQCTAGPFCVNYMLRDPELIAYMKAKDPNPNVIFFLINSETDELCKKNGLNKWGISAELYNYLGNKVQIIDLLVKVGIPFIPNVRSTIKSYQHLLELTANFKTDKICIQDQEGFGGRGTFFVFNEEDYAKQKKILEDGRQFKIMPYRRLKAFAIGGVTTKKGTIIGPLVSELIGHEELTPFQGGYCGNEIRKDYFQDPVVDRRVRREIAEYCIKLLDFLYKEGLFRGIFGLDFTVDLETGEVFFMEINPRIPGHTTLTFQFYEAQGIRFPIFLYHCLEHLDISVNIDIAALNEEWIGVDHYQDVSHIIMRGLVRSEDNLPYSFPAGIWRNEGGVLKHTGSTNFHIHDMQEDDIFFQPNKGIAKGNIIVRHRVQDYDFKLTEQAKQLIHKFVTLRLKDSPS